MINISDAFSSYRSKCFEAFAESINACHHYGSQKWGITIVKPNHFRLVMGNLVVASISQGATWFAVNAGFSSTHQQLNDVINWQWTDHIWMYKRPPSRTGYYWPMDDHKKVWPLIQRIHFSYLAEVSRMYEHLRKTSQKSHSNDFLINLENELGVTLPRPRFLN